MSAIHFLVSGLMKFPLNKIDGRIHLGKFTENPGGVARNIVDAMSKLNSDPVFISAVGEDIPSKLILSTLPPNATRYIQIVPNSSTAQCDVVFDSKGECQLLLGDMEIHKKITPDLIKSNEDVIKNSALLILDGNLTIEAFGTALELAKKHEIPVFFEPTDVVISEKPFKTPHWKAIKFISPNVNELKHIAKILNISIPDHSRALNIEEISCIAKLLAQHIDNIIVTLGARGVVIARYADSSTNLLTTKKDKLQVRHYPVDVVQKIVNVSGAGDCLASALMSSMLRGLSEEQCIAVGFQAALSALQVPAAVPDKLEVNWFVQKVNYVTIV
ncbi:hexokinase family member [Holotrichia oblita]|uniref:Hexokinase family member n=1 Tax=Holotrichia oblita TaxID=644536 RepID=A0ACB9TD70_HOLOL|nr:hexokinase family member [Holotrichia oblita]